MYQQVLELDPDHAAAHINLGTLHYNRQEYALAEKHYRRAIDVDPRYALAYFDLGNVLDETGRVAEAIRPTAPLCNSRLPTLTRTTTLRSPTRRLKEPRKALKHWRAYVKLDTVGPWAVHARNQIQRILQRRIEAHSGRQAGLTIGVAPPSRRPDGRAGRPPDSRRDACATNAKLRSCLTRYNSLLRLL